MHEIPVIRPGHIFPPKLFLYRDKVCAANERNLSRKVVTEKDNFNKQERSEEELELVDICKETD